LSYYLRLDETAGSSELHGLLIFIIFRLP